MASAKYGYPVVANLFEDMTGQRLRDQPNRELEWVLFAEHCDDLLSTRVVDVLRLTRNIVEDDRARANGGAQFPAGPVSIVCKTTIPIPKRSPTST